MARRLPAVLVATGVGLAAAVGGARFGAAQDANTVGAPAPAPTAPPAAAPGDLSQAPPDEASPPAAELPDTTPAPEPERAEKTAAADNKDDADQAPPPPQPLKRPRYTTAVLQALDKVTAETLRFEAPVNEPVRYKDLVLTVHACETTATDEDFSDSMAHVEVQYQPNVLPGRAPRAALQVFRGWMSANSPGLNPFKHPIYDVWVIACKTPAPAPAAPASPPGANL